MSDGPPTVVDVGLQKGKVSWGTQERSSHDQLRITGREVLLFVCVSGLNIVNGKRYHIYKDSTVTGRKLYYRDLP